MATGNDNDINFSIGVDSGGAESGLQRFSAAVESLSSLIAAQAGKVSAASSAFDGLGSAFDKNANKAKGLMSSLADVANSSASAAQKASGIASIGDSLKSLSSSATGAASSLSVFKDLKLLNQGEINSLLGGIKSIQTETGKGISTEAISAAFENAKKVVGATEDQIRAFGKVVMPDFSPVSKELSAITPSGIVGVTNEFVKLQSVITPTVDQLKAAVSAIGSLRAPDLSKVTEALRTASQTPFTGMQVAAPKVTAPNLSDVQKSFGIGRGERTADIFTFTRDEQRENATRNTRRNTRRERSLVDLGPDMSVGPDFLKPLNKEGTMADVLPFNTRKISEEQKAKNNALKEKLQGVREERRIQEQIASEAAAAAEALKSKGGRTSNIYDYAASVQSKFRGDPSITPSVVVGTPTRSQSKKDRDAKLKEELKEIERYEDAKLRTPEFISSITDPKFRKQLMNEAGVSGAATSSSARSSGSTQSTASSKKWMGLENIQGLDQNDPIFKVGGGEKGLEKWLKQNFNPAEIADARAKVELELAKLRQTFQGNVGVRRTAALVSPTERIYSALVTGSGLTPTENLKQYKEDAEKIATEKAKIDKAASDKAKAEKKAQEKYEAGGGFLGKNFGALFGGSSVTSFTGLGGVARALNEPFLKSFGAVGLLAQGVGSIVGSVFSTIGSIASTVASVIYGAFKAAFVGVGIFAGVAVAGATTALLVLKKTAEITFAAFEKGKSLQNLSDSTGVAVGKMLQLENAFKAAGLKGTATTSVLEQMARTLYATSITKSDSTGGGVEGISPKVAFKGLGLNAAELAKMPEEQAFLKIGAAINKLSSPIERNAAAMAIFRSHGAELLALFSNSGAMDLVTQKLSNTNQILADRALVFRAAAERLEKVRPPSFKDAMSQIGTGIADKTVGQFMTITAKMGRIDFSSIGQDLGQQIGLAMQAFRTGNLTQFLKDSIIVFADFAKTKLQEIFTTNTGFGDTLIKAAQDLGAELLAQLDSVFASITGGSFLPMFDNLLSGLSTVASVLIQIGGVIANITVTLVSWAESLLGKLKNPTSTTGKVVGGVVGAAAGFAAAAPLGAGYGAAIGALTPLTAAGGALIGGLITGIPAAIAAGFAGVGVGGVLGADSGKKTLDDKTVSTMKTQLGALADSLGKGNKALSDNIRSILAEAKAREDKTKESKNKETEDAQDRNQQRGIDKAKTDYAEAKKVEDDYKKNNSGRNKQLASKGESANAVGSTMREIGGGGTAYVADRSNAKPEGKTEQQKIEENTRSAKDNLIKILQKLGVTQQGPTPSGMPLDWANANPVLSRNLDRNGMDIFQGPTPSGKTIGQEYKDKITPKVLDTKEPTKDKSGKYMYDSDGKFVPRNKRTAQVDEGKEALDKKMSDAQSAYDKKMSEAKSEYDSKKPERDKQDKQKRMGDEVGNRFMSSPYMEPEKYKTSPNIGPIAPEKSGSVTPEIGGVLGSSRTGTDSTEKMDALITVSKEADRKQVKVLGDILSAISTMSAKVGSSGGGSGSKISVSLTS